MSDLEDLIADVTRRCVPAELMSKTFRIEYSPNCRLPWLVRMPGKPGFIDGKPIRFPIMRPTYEFSEDAFGYGETLREAALAAIKSQETRREVNMVRKSD